MKAYTVVGPTNRNPRRLSSFESAADSGVTPGSSSSRAGRTGRGGGAKAQTSVGQSAGHVERGGGIVDRGLDLAPVADDARIREQALDVVPVERGDATDRESRERPPEGLALAQDRQPREPCLEPLERQQLEHGIVTPCLAAPLVVVVGAVERVGSAPAAACGSFAVQREVVHPPILPIAGLPPAGSVSREQDREIGRGILARIVAPAGRGSASE